MEINEIRELVIELETIKNERNALKIELDALKARKAERKNKSNPDDSKFLAVMSNSLRTLKNQVYQDASAHNLIVRKKIIEGRYSEYKFFSRFNQAVSRLMNYHTFVKECEEQYSLDPETVAQHVVLRGEKAVNKVFKHGLALSFGESDLRLMKKRVFSETELELTQYEPKSHEEEIAQP